MSLVRATSLTSLTSLALLTLTACASAPPAAEPPPSPSASIAPAALAAPPPTATASTSATAAPVAIPIDPGADADALAIASAICPAAIHHDHGKVVVGCRTCPPFTGKDAAPDGRVAVDPPEFYPMEAQYKGAFTGAGKDETAVVFQGCEPHAANYGGTQLVEKVAGTYRLGAYFSGIHPQTCRTLRRTDGRDLLICDWSDAHQSTGFSEVCAIDLAVATPDDVEKGWTALVRVVDNSFQLCMGVDPDAGINQGRVLGYRLDDRNRDGRPDLVVEVEHRHTKGSKALVATIDKACKAALARTPDDPPSLDVSKLLGAPTKETLELLFDGKALTPSAKAARTIKELGKGL